MMTTLTAFKFVIHTLVKTVIFEFTAIKILTTTPNVMRLTTVMLTFAETSAAAKAKHSAERAVDEWSSMFIRVHIHNVMIDGSSSGINI
jgi:hypothetical protein